MTPPIDQDEVTLDDLARVDVYANTAASQWWAENSLDRHLDFAHRAIADLPRLSRALRRVMEEPRTQRLQAQFDGVMNCLATSQRDVEELRAMLADARFALKQAEGWISDVTEREAAVCPEDVGFDEYVRSLQKQLAEARAENDAAQTRLETSLADQRRQLGEQYDELNAKLKRVQTVATKEIIDLQRRCEALEAELDTLCPHCSRGAVIGETTGAKP